MKEISRLEIERAQYNNILHNLGKDIECTLDKLSQAFEQVKRLEFVSGKTVLNDSIGLSDSETREAVKAEACRIIDKVFDDADNIVNFLWKQTIDIMLERGKSLPKSYAEEDYEDERKKYLHRFFDLRAEDKFFELNEHADVISEDIFDGKFGSAWSIQETFQNTFTEYASELLKKSLVNKYSTLIIFFQALGDSGIEEVRKRARNCDSLPVAVSEVLESVYTFDDISLRLDDRGIQSFFMHTQYNFSDFAVALSGAKRETVHRYLRNLTTEYADDMEELIKNCNATPEESERMRFKLLVDIMQRIDKIHYSWKKPRPNFLSEDLDSSL